MILRENIIGQRNGDIYPLLRMVSGIYPMAKKNVCQLIECYLQKFHLCQI